MARSVITRLMVLSALIFVNLVYIGAQPDEFYRLPAGTRIHLKLEVELSSRVASANDTFLATVSRPVLRSDVVALPEGTQVTGRVLHSSPASAGMQNGHLEVLFERVTFERGQERVIAAKLVESSLDRPSRSSVASVLSIVGGTSLGALLGSLGHSRGSTAVGAGVGAGVGTAVALARKGREMRIGKDEEFEIELTKEVVLPIRDY